MLDLAELALPPLRERLRFLSDPPAALVRLSGAIRAADAIIVVSPEYNGGIPAALKNALDALHDEWSRKPVGIASVSAGALGGAQVLAQLQLFFLRMKALPVATLRVPRVLKSFDESGEPLEERYRAGSGRMLDELTRYAGAAFADRP